MKETWDENGITVESGTSKKVIYEKDLWPMDKIATLDELIELSKRSIEAHSSPNRLSFDHPDFHKAMEHGQNYMRAARDAVILPLLEKLKEYQK